MSDPPDVVVGIDLGTTNSLVAVCDERGPRVIPDERGRALLPSVVRYEVDPRTSPGLADSATPSASAEGDLRAPAAIVAAVGYEAKEHAAEFPRTTISSVKRLMGRSKADTAADLAFLSYHVVEGPHNTARIEIPADSKRMNELSAPGVVRTGGQAASGTAPIVVSPQEVSAVILRRLKEQASRALGVEVKEAVVTVPAYFDDAQRQATRDAGRIAGLEVVRIVNEPTAAAMAYGLGIRGASPGLGPPRNSATPSGSPEGDVARTVAVFDLGGGTFDVSILRLIPATPGEETEFFQVIATAGDTRLGGDDVDHALVEVFEREIKVEFARPGKRDVVISAEARQALLSAAERAKCRLSEFESAEVEVEIDGHLIYRRRVTREELERLAGPWVERAMVCCERAVRDGAKNRGQRTVDRGHSEGSVDRNESMRRVGVPLDAVILVGGSTRMPLVRRRVEEFFGLRAYTAIDPDQAVALGAAVQASVLSGARKGMLLLDVIPLSLGVETVGGAVAKIIMRNSPVPTRAHEMFSTSVDGQGSIRLSVYQGEREMAADCRKLGEFHLRGLPPMPAGIPQLEVEFLVDANGVLSVSAHERRSGKRATLQVVPNHGLTRDEVDRMERDSYAHAREDMTRHRIVDLIANGRLDLKWIGERLEKFGAKLEASYAEDLRSQISNLKGMIEAAERDWRLVDADALQRAKEGLDRASVRLQEVGIAESLRGGQ